jgi:hypothetical protein
MPLALEWRPQIQPSRSLDWRANVRLARQPKLRGRELAKRRLVENTGLEPVTSWLQTRRSPS